MPDNTYILILNRFLGLCVLKTGPQDLPASSLLLVICSASYVISGAAGVAMYYGWPAAAQIIMADTVLLVLFANGALAMRGFPRRSTQTMTALLGAGVIFHLLVLLSKAAGLPDTFMPAVMIWHAIVFANIIRHALEIPFMFGFGLTCFYIFVSLGVTATIAADKVG